MNLTKLFMPEVMRQKIPEFQSQIEALAADLSLNLTDFEIDHIAMRINQLDVAQTIHQAWGKQGRQVSSAIIHGRPIIIFKLNQPILFLNQSIRYLELPYPGDKRYPKQGWEHIEIVIPSQAQTVDQFLKDVFKQCPLFAKKYTELASFDIKVKTSSPQGEGECKPNPCIAFKRKDVCIKLHPIALKNVIVK